MNVFHMLSKIAPIIASLATESTSMSLGTIFLYVFIELLVASCNKYALNSNAVYLCPFDMWLFRLFWVEKLSWQNLQL